MPTRDTPRRFSGDAKGMDELPATGLASACSLILPVKHLKVGIAQQGSMLLVSRGVIDSEGRGNGHSVTLGVERVQQVFESWPAATARSLWDSVLEAVADFSANLPQRTSARPPPEFARIDPNYNEGPPPWAELAS